MQRYSRVPLELRPTRGPTRPRRGTSRGATHLGCNRLACLSAQQDPRAHKTGRESVQRRSPLQHGANDASTDGPGQRAESPRAATTRSWSRSGRLCNENSSAVRPGPQGRARRGDLRMDRRLVRPLTTQQPRLSMPCGIRSHSHSNHHRGMNNTRERSGKPRQAPIYVGLRVHHGRRPSVARPHREDDHHGET